MAKKLVRKYTADELVERLRGRYGSDAWLLLEQVANSTGYSCKSWIDAIAIGLWPSKGLLRLAFEVKVSRSDFLKELATPKKNAWARKCCHEFWFVAPDGVIKEQELPEGAGWLKPRGKGLTTVRAASRKETVKTTDGFIASLCRNASGESKRRTYSEEQDILDKCEEYQEAKVWEEAGRRFLKGRSMPWYPVLDWENEDAASELVKELEKAATPEADRNKAQEMTRVLERFSEQMSEFFWMFCTLANYTLDARDEAGDAIVKAYHTNDHEKLAREARKALKRSDLRGVQEMQRLIESVKSGAGA